MIVPTSTLCPACKTKNHPNRLRREIGDDALFCVDPKNGKTLHTFPDIDSVEAYNPELAYLEDESAPEEPEPPPTPKKAPAPPVEAPIAKQAPPEDPASIRELDPVPVAAAQAEQVTHFYPDNDESKAPQKGDDTERIEPPSLFNVPPPPKVVKFNPPPARKAPGGVLILTARIPDQYIGPFQVQAVEHLKTTVEAYFQECVERALENAWWF